MALHGAYDLVILDVMLPGLNGWQVLQSLRERGLQMPVLFLTARDQVEDRVKGLELGADDYLVKPFSFAELLARVRIILRRGPAGNEAPCCASPIWSWICAAGSRATAAHGPDGQGVRPAGTADAPPRRGAAAFPDRFAGVGHELRQRHQCHRSGDAPTAREDRRGHPVKLIQTVRGMGYVLDVPQEE
jgi:two-component system copper resistance phosphate regulon response regulator CusR